jgi:hypothetical protein
MANLLFDSDQLRGSRRCGSGLFLFGLAFRRAVGLTAHWGLCGGTSQGDGDGWQFPDPWFGIGLIWLAMIQTRSGTVRVEVTRAKLRSLYKATTGAKE